MLNRVNVIPLSLAMFRGPFTLNGGHSEDFLRWSHFVQYLGRVAILFTWNVPFQKGLSPPPEKGHPVSTRALWYSVGAQL